MLKGIGLTSNIETSTFCNF